MPTRSYAAHKRKVAAWVKNYLGYKHAVSSEAVRRTHKLRHWGVVHEGHLAELAGAFNRDMLVDPHGVRVVLPPDLIDAIGEDASGQRISDLIDFLAPTTAPLTVPFIEDRLKVRLISEHPDITKPDFSLRGVTLGTNEGHLLDLDLDPVYKRAHNVCQHCINTDPKKTVPSVASCMLRQLQERPA